MTKNVWANVPAMFSCSWSKTRWLGDLLMLHIYLLSRGLCTAQCAAECDVPVPGIPVPGNLSLFLMVSEPVSEKFGTEKSPGTGLEKFLVRKKSQDRSRKFFGTEKSP